jgi:hypothetical protein
LNRANDTLLRAAEGREMGRLLRIVTITGRLTKKLRPKKNEELKAELGLVAKDFNIYTFRQS